MNKRKEPRHAIPAASEMQPPNRPPAAGPGKQKTKVKRKAGSRLRVKTSRPDWLKPFALILLAAGLLYFVYSSIEKINNTLRQNQQNAAITDVWRQLLSSDVTISGSPTNLDATGSPVFPLISFESASSKAELHRELRLSSALPGIQSVGLQPESTRRIGRGYADDETLLLLAENFTELDTLSLSGSRVTTLEPLADIKIRELRLINTPIKREKLSTLSLCEEISVLWVGWEPDLGDPDQEVFGAESYKLRLIQAVAQMPNLTTLRVFNMSFTAEEQKKLGGVSIEKL